MAGAAGLWQTRFARFLASCNFTYLWPIVRPVAVALFHLLLLLRLVCSGAQQVPTGSKRKQRRPSGVRANESAGPQLDLRLSRRKRAANRWRPASQTMQTGRSLADFGRVCVRVCQPGRARSRIIMAQLGRRSLPARGDHFFPPAARCLSSLRSRKLTGRTEREPDSARARERERERESARFSQARPLQVASAPFVRPTAGLVGPKSGPAKRANQLEQRQLAGRSSEWRLSDTDALGRAPINQTGEQASARRLGKEREREREYR